MYDPSGVAPMNSDSPGKTAPGRDMETLTPITARQAKKAQQIQEKFVLDNQELKQVTLIAKVVGRDDQPNRLSLVLDDGTEVIEAQIFINADDPPAWLQQKDLWAVNTYVRVYGQLFYNDGTVSISAFRVKDLTDTNEITMHSLDVIHAHLCNTRGPDPASAGVPPLVPLATSPGQPGMQAYGNYTNTGNTTSPVQDKVLECIKQYQARSDGGTSADTIYTAMENHYRRNDIRQALDHLLSEARVVTTGDDEHFQVA